MKLKIGAGNLHAGYGIEKLNDKIYPAADIEDWMLLSQASHIIEDHEGEEVEVIYMSTDEATIRVCEFSLNINPFLLE